MVKRAVEAANGGTEGVVVDVERLGGDAVLDRDVNGGEFEGGRSRVAVVIEHVAIHREIFIKAP